MLEVAWLARTVHFLFCCLFTCLSDCRWETAV